VTWLNPNDNNDMSVRCRSMLSQTGFDTADWIPAFRWRTTQLDEHHSKGHVAVRDKKCTARVTTNNHVHVAKAPFTFSCASYGTKCPTKKTVTILRTKVDFWKKASYKLCLCENFQRQSCKAFTGLSNHAQMVDGDVLLYLKFWATVTYSLQNGDF